MPKILRFPTERSAGHKLRHLQLAIAEMLAYKHIDGAIKKPDYSEHVDRLRLPLPPRV